MADYYKTFTNILEEELITALGCTEPIALALAGAKCRETLGRDPESMTVSASGNIIKNVQGVIIPGTRDLRGVDLAAILGMLVGDSSGQLEVLQGLDSDMIKKGRKLSASGFCHVKLAPGKPKLYFEIYMKGGEDEARVEVMHVHTNITRIEKNGERIVYNPCQEDDFNSSLNDRTVLSLEKILDFANGVNLDEIIPILKKQISNNLAIATQGLNQPFGLNVGRSLLNSANGSIKEKMKAFAASGSDARMSGCDLPVVINSGSGNQGLTIASPIFTYSKEMQIDEDRMYRALALANLVPIHIKTRIGRLSAFCGAVTAGIGVGCAVSYLNGGGLCEIEDTVKNGLANLTGVICDGAKPSCALKIASSVDAAIMASNLALEGKAVESGTGIIYNTAEDTIHNVAEIASEAMVETDQLILKIMTSRDNKTKVIA